MDSEKGARWAARDLKAGVTYPRRLTHLLILAVAVVPITATAASAHSAAPSRQRIQLTAAAQDHPENFRLIPADALVAATPPPPPPPAPAPKPKPQPKPRLVSVVVPVARGNIAGIIRAAAARYGDNPDQLLRVAMCESGLNPNAQNRSGASGLFQFKPGTFYGHGGHNIWDPYDQADVAARMFSQGLASAWTCR